MLPTEDMVWSTLCGLIRPSKEILSVKIAMSATAIWPHTDGGAGGGGGGDSPPSEHAVKEWSHSLVYVMTTRTKSCYTSNTVLLLQVHCIHGLISQQLYYWSINTMCHITVTKILNTVLLLQVHCIHGLISRQLYYWSINTMCHITVTKIFKGLCNFWF